MSEPMSSTEIEDVLSSIRRLVSDDLRPVSRTQPAAPANSDKGRLILTPALRVVQDTAVAEPQPEPLAQSKPEPGPDPKADSLPVFVATRRLHLIDDEEAPFVEAAPAAIGQVVATLAAAVQSGADDWEPEQGDPLETGIAAEGWELPQVAFEVRHQFWTAPEPTPMPEETSVAVEEEVPSWAQGDDEESHPDSDELLQDAVHGTIEPDSDWADAAEASVIASLQAEADDLQARNNTAAENEVDHETRFDEVVLRELVRDILREELAGKMGERITRNIRKLVRAEIAIIMATQSLD